MDRREIYSLETEPGSSKKGVKYCMLSWGKTSTGNLREGVDEAPEGTDPGRFAGHCTGNIQRICSG